MDAELSWLNQKFAFYFNSHLIRSILIFFKGMKGDGFKLIYQG